MRCSAGLSGLVLEKAAGYHRLMKAALLPLLLVAQSEAFNLDCSGAMTVRTRLTFDEMPYRTVYRIDLAGQKWCEGECLAVRDIYETQPGFITLEANTGGLTSSYTRLDRVTGEHMAGRSEGRGSATVSTSWRGECRRADFTGFPDVETKF
jgi:hypothetical protein